MKSNVYFFISHTREKKVVILVTHSQSLMLQGFDGNQTQKKVVTKWLLNAKFGY